jgi:hypothetical protein
MTIRSRVPNEQYKQEWERIFGKSKKDQVDQEGTDSHCGQDAKYSEEAVHDEGSKIN